MKEYAKKFPKAWKEYVTEFTVIYIGFVDRLPDKKFFDIKLHFGYLVLEYFPAHGIEIMRDMKYSNIKGFESHYRIHDKRYTYDTPEEAILKAFEIREKQLEGK